MLDIPFQTALDLGRSIAAKKITSLELTLFYLDRLQAYGGELGAVVTITRDTALRQAKQFDREVALGKFRSPMHGVPYGIKDLFSTKGIPTTWGSPVYRDRIINHDAAVVVKLRQAGCPLLGKLSMVEFAGCVGYRYANASLTGAGRTPWNSGHWAGGSSSGSGASVAAGLVGFAIGTETWGSIVCPSSFCGVTGLRPTAGRVSRDGAMTLSWTMDKIGPIARSVADTAAILELISGPGGVDAGLRSNISAKFVTPKKYKPINEITIGIVRPNYGTGIYVQPETDQVFNSALKALEIAGARVVEVKLPDIPSDEAAEKIVAAEAASAFENVTRDPKAWAQVVDPSTRAGLISNLATPAVDYIRALRIRGLAQQMIPEVFAKCDVLVAPSLTQVAPPVTVSLDDYFAAGDDGRLSGFGNMLGLPAISVPMGFGAHKLPLGLQIVGAPLDEATLLAVASAYENVTDWHSMVPPKYSTTE